MVDEDEEESQTMRAGNEPLFISKFDKQPRSRHLAHRKTEPISTLRKTANVVWTIQ